MQSHAHSQLKHHIQQPLFKLSTSSVSQSPPTPASYFASPNVSKTAYHGHQLNIRPVNSPNTYLRPNNPRQKEKGSCWICFFFNSTSNTKLLRQKVTGFLCNKTTLICSYQLYLRLITLIKSCRSRKSGQRQGAISRKNSYLAHSSSSRSRENKKVENVHRDRNKRKGEKYLLSHFFSCCLVLIGFDMAKDNPFSHNFGAFIFPFLYRRKNYKKLCKR